MKIDFIYTNQYPHLFTQDEVLKTITFMEDFWNEYGTAIEQALLGITGLSFVTDPLTCYLNSKGSQSDPLSVKIEEYNDMADNLCHELSHVLMTQHYGVDKDFTAKIDAFHTKYLDEPFLTRVHILVHAIHLLLAQKLFPSHIEAIKNYSRHPDYVRAWEIVDKEGAENIVSLIR